jgi:hypothetical protein
LLRKLDNRTDVFKKTITINVYNTTELDLAFEYNIIDLDILRSKNKIRIEVRRRKLIKAASALYIISQHYSPLSSKGLSN